MMVHSAHRQAFEARIVEIVQCLAALCDTEIGIHTNPDQIASLSEEDGSCILGYDVAPIPQHFQFDCDLVPIEAAYLKHKQYRHYAARVGLRFHLPNQIEQILRARFTSSLMDQVDYALTGHSDLEFEMVYEGLLVCFLQRGFDNFTVDGMTDTMLRQSYVQIVKDLDPIMPWLRFARFLAQQHSNHEQIDAIQKRLPSILDNALRNQSVADEYVFTLCELSGSFDPALRLFKKRYGNLFADISG
jgi:hypothetical protein